MEISQQNIVSPETFGRNHFWWVTLTNYPLSTFFLRSMQRGVEGRIFGALNVPKGLPKALKQLLNFEFQNPAGDPAFCSLFLRIFCWSWRRGRLMWFEQVLETKCTTLGLQNWWWKNLHLLASWQSPARQGHTLLIESKMLKFNISFTVMGWFSAWLILNGKSWSLIFFLICERLWVGNKDLHVALHNHANQAVR